MKPNFALNLSHEGIGILHRTQFGWMYVANVSLDDPELEDQLAVLRRTVADLGNGRVITKLVIPNSQILYTEVYAPGPDYNAQIVQIRQGLEGKTPYDVCDLVFDWRNIGQSAKVAVAFSGSLKEAESFAVQHGFNPISFVAIPKTGSFDGEPFFGTTAHSASILGRGENIEPDLEPMIIIGSHKPFGKVTAQQFRPPDPDHQRDAAAFTPQYSPQPTNSGPYYSGEPVLTAGEAIHPSNETHGSATSGNEKNRLPVGKDRSLTGASVTAPHVSGSGDAHRPIENLKPKATRQVLASGTTHHVTAHQPLAGRMSPPGSVSASIRNGKTAFAIQYPIRKRVWPRLMIMMLAPILLIAVCVVMFFWLRPGQVESDLSQPLRFQAWPEFQTGPRTADGPSMSAREGDGPMRLPVETARQESAGPPEQATPGNSSVATAKPQPLSSDSPPPDRILEAPPSLAESWRTYAQTGVWPRDPGKPVELVGDVRTENTYIATISPVPSTRSKVKGQSDNLRLAGLDHPLAPSSSDIIRSGTYWRRATDRIPSGSLDRRIYEMDRNSIASAGSRSVTQPAAMPEAARADPPDPGQVRLRPDEANDRDSPPDIREIPDNESGLAAGISPIPKVRPKGMELAWNQVGDTFAGSHSNADLPDGDSEATASESASVMPANVAGVSHATQYGVIDLRKTNLIGTYGATDDLRALIRLKSGAVIKDVKAGDRFDGGRVSKVGTRELHYVKNGKNVTLRMPDR